MKTIYKLLAIVMVLGLVFGFMPTSQVKADYATFDNPNYYYANITNAPEGTKYRQAGLSPDGTHIVAVKQVGTAAAEGWWEIVLMNADGSGQTIISAGKSGTGDIDEYTNPFWSDDGTVIGYVEVHKTNPNKVIAYNVGTHTNSYIYEPVSPKDVANPDFLGSSNTSIVFWDIGTGGADLFTWDGLTLTNITNTADYKEYEPISNADGSKIIYWSGETNAEQVNTTHTLTNVSGNWTKDVGFTPIPDSYWAYWTTPAANAIALTVMSSKDILLYNNSGTFVTDLSGAGYSGGTGQWNFFGSMPQGPNGELVFTSNAGRSDPATGRDIIIANPRSNLYVSTTGSDANPGTAAAPFKTIQKAINVAVDGGTIHVAAGTYSEAGQIVIDKNLSIIGTDKATTIIKPSADTSASGDTRGWFLVNSGITFNLSNVTLDGTGHKVWQGIRHYGSGTIDNVAFTHIQYEPSGGSYAGTAVAAFGGSGANVDVKNSTFDNIGRVGVLYYGAEQTGTYDNNTYTGKGAGNWLDYGVEVGAGAHATISNSSISACKGVASDKSTSAGVLVTTYYGPGSAATISSNTFTGNTAGIAVGYDSTDTSSVIAKYNKFIGNDYGVTSEAPTVDASPNWWNSVNGPLLGDHTFGPINFVKWCADEECKTFAPDDNGVIELSGPINLSGGIEINVPHLTIHLAADTLIQNSSPCFIINASYTTILAEPGAKCIPTNRANGIDVAADLTNIVVKGLEITKGDTATGDGIHFAGVVTDTVLVDNFIHGLDGNGIFFGAQPVAQTEDAIDIHGNLFQNNTKKGIEAGSFTVPAEFNSWGHYAAPVAGTDFSTGVDADPFTHVDLYLVPSGTPWLNQVVKTSTITYAVKAHMVNVNAADFVLKYDKNFLSVNTVTPGVDFVGVPLNDTPTYAALVDSTVAGELHFRGVKLSGVVNGDVTLFTVTFNADAAGTSTLNFDETTDLFGMPGAGSSVNVYAAALSDGSVKVIDLPSLTSTDIQGYYLTGDAQAFHVTVTNPSTGGNYVNSIYYVFTIHDAVLADLNSLTCNFTGTPVTIPMTVSGSNLVGRVGFGSAGFPMAPGFSTTTTCTANFANAKSYGFDVFMVDNASDPVDAVLATLNSTAVVYVKPVITSPNLAGPYLVGIPQAVTVTITNPSFIPGPFDLHFNFPDGTVLVYGGTTYPCTSGVCTVPVSLPATSNDLTFTVTFAAPFNANITVDLYDSGWTPDRLLATLTKPVVSLPNFTVTGTVSMQGRTARAGVPMTLSAITVPYGPYSATSIEQISNNLSFANVAEGTYTVTTNQPRYLNVYADLNKTVAISASKTSLAKLELKGGNAVWTDNLIDIFDAVKVGSTFGETSGDGDVNFDNKVNIQDLALVGGNYDLTSDGVYANWVP